MQWSKFGFIINHQPPWWFSETVMTKVICGFIASYKSKMLVLKNYNTIKIEIVHWILSFWFPLKWKVLLNLTLHKDPEFPWKLSKSQDFNYVHYHILEGKSYLRILTPQIIWITAIPFSNIVLNTFALFIAVSYHNGQFYTLKSSRSEAFCKKVVLRKFVKFTGKHLRQGVLFNKVDGFCTLSSVIGNILR